MSYIRPTLISQIVQKGRKVSINPRNEDDGAPGAAALPTAVSPRRERESYEAPFRSSAKDGGGEGGRRQKKMGEKTMPKRIMEDPRRECVLGDI